MSRQNRFWSQLLLVISLPTLFGCGGGTVNAPPPVTLSVTSLGLNPSSVTGGQSSTGTVTLNGPAPSGGAAVTLSSGNAAAQVPGAVNIPAGSATATFQATSAAVNAVTPVTITATLNGTATGALTINPASVATIGFNPNSVTGGQSTSGTVTLNGPAPAGGVTVQLSSGNPAGVSFPSSVNIPAGNTSKTFQTTTPSVVVVTVVALTATLNGSVVGKLYLDPVSSTVVSLMLGTNMFQTFEAWRGTLTGPDLQDPNGVMVPLPQATINQAIADMDDLGLNGFRITLFGSDFIPTSFNPPVYNFTKIDSSVQAIVIPLKQRVEARGELFSTYISLAADSTTFQKLTNNDQAVYQQFVQQFRTFALDPKNFGFEPTYWVVVNEPDNSGYSADFVGRFADTAAAELAALNSPTKIQTLETGEPDRSLLDIALSQVSATDAKQIGVYSFHSYDDDTVGIPLKNAGRNLIRDLARTNGLKTASTEICCISGWNGSYPQVMGISRDIYWNLTEADASIWEPLGVMNTCGNQPLGCPNGAFDYIIIDQHDFTKIYLYPAYYGWRQWAHYIRPGYQRVDLTCQSNCTSAPAPVGGPSIKPVAFRSPPPAGKIVMVILNDQSSATTQTILISGLPIGTYIITGVDPASTNPTLGTARTYPPQTVTAAGTLRIDLPPQALVTIVQQ